MTCIEKVRDFWEKNPLWTGESKHQPGSLSFFKEHKRIYYKDCFAGSFDPRFLPINDKSKSLKILDLGCGVGFWATEFASRGFTDVHASDLTHKALELTATRLDLHGLKADLSLQNAEKTSFEDESFDHVNCQGVIHHTPDTNSAVKEIFRILKPGGSASISVYYRNIFLQAWPILRSSGWLLSQLGGKLKGRGRENIYQESDVNEIVRLYDGAENPIGKSYSKKQLIDLLEPYFMIKETYLHFFPARSLPFKIPNCIHRFLDKRCGFMIYATLQKKCAE
jgi:SAM-dependent methyltransferase